MTVYERRPIEVLDCVSLYIYSIEQTENIGCDSSGGNCVWVGGFKVLTYNLEEPATYDWTTDAGVINSGQDAEECEIWVNAIHPMTFETTVIVTCATGTHSKTITCETSDSGAPMVTSP